MHYSKREYRRKAYQALFDQRRKKVLVFSPDPDLAQSLILLLENKFDVACETKIGNLERQMKELTPQLLLLDLFACLPDNRHCLEVVKRIRARARIPIVLLRGYARVNEDIEREISELTTWIFYKPLNGELIGEVLEAALSEHPQKERSLL